MFDELYRLASMSGMDFSNTLRLMHKRGELQTFLPEICELDHYCQNPDHHPEGKTGIKNGTVLDHVLAALYVQTKENEPVLNLCILFHDIGKSVTGVKHPEHGMWCTFNGHNLAGLEVIKSVYERFNFPKDLCATINYCIEYHSKINKFKNMKLSTISHIVSHPSWYTLEKVHECDAMCRQHKFNRTQLYENLDMAHNVREFVLNKEENNQNKNKNKDKLSGDLVMRLCNIEEGKLVGDIIKKVKESIDINPNTNQDDINECVLFVYNNLK